MQRVRMSLPYYRANGWEPVVLAVEGPWQGCTQEPDLLASLPSDVRIVRTRALPACLCRVFGVSHLGLRAWGHFLWRGCRLLGAEKFDLVFFSNTQFVTFTLGRIWRRLYGVPYVLDVQDPWRTDYYERPGSRRPPGGWKYRAARLQARLLEGWAFARAGAIMSVSPHYLEDLRARYPRLAATPSAVLCFGASEADLEQARRLPAPASLFSRGPGEVHLVYTGASGPVMPHALLVLFTALRRYRERSPEKAARLRFHFVGTSYVPAGQGKPSVLPIAEQCGVRDLVGEIPHRLGFLEAARWQLEADALLLLGSSDLAYSPSKVYQYRLTGRPIVGLVFRDSVMEALLDALSCAFIVRFRESGPKEQAYAELARAFDLLVTGTLATALPPPNEAAGGDNFRAEELTRRQCALFERALSSPP